VLDALMPGEIADGGGDFTVVSALLFEFTELLLVLSVTIGCALASVQVKAIIATNAIFNFLIFLPHIDYVFNLTVFIIQGKKLRIIYLDLFNFLL
jgi:hypothetical protein